MGTTVTPNLGLIKPDIDESIKQNLPTFPGWASQNATNMDKLDALFRASSTTYTLNWTGSGGNPTLGSGGFTEGKYVRLWPRMVMVHFRIFTGTTGFAAGSGTYRINLPVAPVAEFATFNLMPALGKAVLLDNDTVLSSSNMIVVWDPAVNLAVMRSPGGNFFQPTNPITLAQSDRISGYCIYPTSAP